MFAANSTDATVTNSQVVKVFDVTSLPAWAQSRASIVEACKQDLFFRYEVMRAAACDSWFTTTARSICKLYGRGK